MAMTMQLNIVSAEEEIFSDLAEMVIVPGSGGDLGIMPQHSQLLSTLKPGEVIITNPGGEKQSIFVSGGILEVQPHVVTVLSDTAIRAADLDEAKAEASRQKAEQMLADKADNVDVAQAQALLMQSIEQLKMIDSMRKRKSH